MQPQSAQIEKIAEALRVSAGAISGSNSELIHLKTVGDLMGLLMVWHKSGSLTIQGKREEDRQLNAATVRLVLNSIFEKCLTLPRVNAKKEETIQLDSLKIALQDSGVMNDLLHWESLYNGYGLMCAKYGDTSEEQVKASLDELRENLELIEMELQGSTEIL